MFWGWKMLSNGKVDGKIIDGVNEISREIVSKNVVFVIYFLILVFFVFCERGWLGVVINLGLWVLR